MIIEIDLKLLLEFTLLVFEHKIVLLLYYIELYVFYILNEIIGRII